AAERVFKQNKVRHEIVPVPRALSSDCQMALKFMSKDFELVSKWLHDSRVHTMAIYEDRNGQYTKLSLPLRF
ncbi:MAG TPA: DUF3343 domain-containing protein, partial [Oligoflexia bacterium]|nr:DUF3343 domain-containing protein [Oligoflexia bacterium]